MVHGDDRRAIWESGELACEPVSPRVAESAAVPPRFGRIEHQQAQRSGIDGIMQKRPVGTDLWKGADQRGPVIVIARDRPDRARGGAERLGEPAEALAIAVLGEIAGQQQQVDAIGPIPQPFEHGAQAVHVGLVGIARLETDVDVADLGNQQGLGGPGGHVKPRMYS